MGAMGYGVYDNDDAMDFAAVIGDWLLAQLEDASPEKVRVVADLAGGGLGDTLGCRAKEDLATLRDIMIGKLAEIPNEWFECWRDPDLIHYEVNRTIRKLKELEE